MFMSRCGGGDCLASWLVGGVISTVRFSVIGAVRDLAFLESYSVYVTINMKPNTFYPHMYMIASYNTCTSNVYVWVLYLFKLFFRS